MHKKRRRKNKKLRILLLVLILTAIIVTGVSAISNIRKGNDVSNGNNDQNLGNSVDKEIPNKEKPEEPKEPIKVVESDITINLSSVGDIMLHPSQIDGSYDKATDTYDFTNSFKYIKPLLEKADLAIGNFEGTTAGNETYEYQGYPIFNAPDEILDALKDTGFDVLSTINNHALDTRKAGVIRTIEQIKKRGMSPVGTYVEKPDTRVVMKDVKGIKIAFLAYTEMLNGLDSALTPEDLDAMINKVDRDKISEDIIYAKEQKADVIIAMIHWGDEYQRAAAPRQRELADFMFTQGVNIIYGNHPHVVQESEIMEYDGEKVFVAYAMGNFISNQRYETISYYDIADAQYTEDGLMVNIEIEKKGETGKVSIKNVTYTPLWVYKGVAANGREEHVVVPIMEYVESDDFNNNSKERMNRSYKDTTSQLEVFNNN